MNNNFNVLNSLNKNEGGGGSKRGFNKKKIVGLTGVVAGVIALAVLIGSCTTKIEPGYNGVVYSLNGGLKKDVLNQGLRLHAPWESVTQYPTSTETVYLTKSNDNESFDINTSDGKSVNVDVVYAYHMEADKLPHIFTKFRRKTHEEIQAGYIKTQIKTVMQEVSTTYSVLGIYAEHRNEVTKQIHEKLSTILAKDGIVLENFSLSDVRPDEKTLKSIQAIADAQNKQEFLKREQKNKEQEAINAKIEAQGKKQVAIVNAEAEAEKTRIEAEAKAEANRKLQQSLSDQLVQYEWIKKWNGQMPTVQGSGSIIQMPADMLKQNK
ncbi:prohibitin family protein [Hazenella coriacea]|uniref:Regulator of protease activity HflC (Stomatin/prohibitin superfamily) n=1 Tax=Hazenella coriacea TaxID=1179467 RepID=A0A4R3L8A1_9BACL|nr:prohibitin family protein [Hazenella coriacea]TCS95792.1 regulator of protease activity HflC (stomatin/prohibitin superfamily) [Hazenella coriacea]